jgi:hypothetical protein
MVVLNAMVAFHNNKRAIYFTVRLLMGRKEGHIQSYQLTKKPEIN